jgi:hypothetical protein
MQNVQKAEMKRLLSKKRTMGHLVKTYLKFSKVGCSGRIRTGSETTSTGALKAVPTIHTNGKTMIAQDTIRMI